MRKGGKKYDVVVPDDMKPGEMLEIAVEDWCVASDDHGCCRSVRSSWGLGSAVGDPKFTSYRPGNSAATGLAWAFRVSSQHLQEQANQPNPSSFGSCLGDMAMRVASFVKSGRLGPTVSNPNTGLWYIRPSMFVQILRILIEASKI